MGHELAAYLAEFEGALAEAPSRWAVGGLALEPVISPSDLLPTRPTLTPTPALVAAMPAVYRASAERAAASIVERGILPERLPAGSSAMVIPVPPPPPPPATPEAWTVAMGAEQARIRGLEIEAEDKRRRGIEKSARTEHPDAHIANNYRWRQYPIPASGTCDPSELVWLDIFLRAKEILARMAMPPPRGVTWASVKAWAGGIDRLVALLVESTNIRDAFFTLRPAWQGAGYMNVDRTRLDARGYLEAGDGGRLPGVLASTAQGRGAYDHNTRGDTAQAWEAMQYAPQARGGLEELMPDLRAIMRTRNVWTCGDPPHCRFVTGTESWYENVMTQAFVGWANSGATRFPVGVLGRPGGPYATRTIPGTTLDIAALVANAANLARIAADPRLSFGAIYLRSMNFYTNAYLDFAAQHGVLPRDVVQNARAAWAGIQSSATAALTTSAGTTFGIITAVASAINAGAGAIIGLVLGLLTSLLQALGAAVGTGPTVPLPFYQRMYGGSCAIRGWEPPPASPPSTLATPSETAPIWTPIGADGPPPTPEPEKKGGLILGAGAIAFGLWLLSGRK